MASHYLRKYAVAATIPFELYKLDGTGLKTDAASATGDITLYRDEGANEVLDADAFADEGVSYSLVLSQAEMTAKHIIVHIVDQSSPQVWLDKVLIVETYGNASAEHIFDLGTATQNVNVASIDNIDFGATMKASINTEVDNALNTAIPASNTATSVNDVLLDVLTLAAINAEVDTALNTAVPASNTANSINDLLLDQIDVVVDNIHDTDLPAVKSDTGAIKAITDLLTLTAIADAVHDEVTEGTTTLRQSVKLISSALFAKTSGGATATLISRDIGDTKARITLTTDADGNRTASVLDGT